MGHLQFLVSLHNSPRGISQAAAELLAAPLMAVHIWLNQCVLHCLFFNRSSTQAVRAVVKELQNPVPVCICILHVAASKIQSSQENQCKEIGAEEFQLAFLVAKKL